MTIDCTEMKKVTHMKAHRWTGEQYENLKKPITVCSESWSPRYRLSVLSTKCGGRNPKVLIVSISQKIKQIIIIIIITILTLICLSQ